jgi:hypothetical protein
MQLIRNEELDCVGPEIVDDMSLVEYLCTVEFTEAEFLDVIGKKPLRVLFLAIQSHLYYPLSKSGLKQVCNVNIVFVDMSLKCDLTRVRRIHNFEANLS